MNAAVMATITKIDKYQHIVEGVAASSKLDRDRQIIDETFLQENYAQWVQDWGNLRYMHEPRVCGKVLSCSDWDDQVQGFYITAKISDDSVWEQVLNKELMGFSIGIKNPVIISDPIAENGRLIDGEIIETSIVDIPSAYDAKITAIKSPIAATFDESSNSWKVNKLSNLESYEDLCNRIESALNDAFGAGAGYPGFVTQTYPDHVVVHNWNVDKYYSIPYEDNNGKITFGQSAEVEKKFIPVEVQKYVVAEVAKRASGDDDWMQDMVDDMDTDTADTAKRFYGAKERRDMPESDFAGPHRSFPIKDQEDVDNAAHLIGHAKNPAEVKSRIIEIAHRKGLKIPEAWQEDKVDKTLDTSSGLQPYNLEGENGKKEEKTTVAEGTMNAEETKAAISSMRNVMENMMTSMNEIRAQIEAMANQVDPDRDGDIDNKNNPEQENDETPDKGKPVETANQDAQNAVELTERDGLGLSEKTVQTLVDAITKSVIAQLGEQVNIVTKSATADVDGVKGMVAGLQKMASELDAQMKGFGDRLEVVEQSAAPSKGVATVVADKFAGVTNPAEVNVAEIIKTVRANNQNLSPKLLQQKIDEAIENAKGGNN